MTALVLMNDYS